MRFLSRHALPLLIASNVITACAPPASPTIAVFGHATSSFLESVVASDVHDATCVAGRVGGTYDLLWGQARAMAADTDGFLLCINGLNVVRFATTVASSGDDDISIHLRNDGTLVSLVDVGGPAITVLGPSGGSEQQVGALTLDGVPLWSQSYAHDAVDIVALETSGAETFAVADVHRAWTFAGTELRRGPAVLVWSPTGEEQSALPLADVPGASAEARTRRIAVGPDGLLYVVISFTIGDDTHDHILALDRTGRALWDIPGPGDGLSDILVDGDHLYLAGWIRRPGYSLEGFIVGLWTDDGSRDAYLPTSLLGNAIGAHPSGSLVYGGSSTGALSGIAVLGTCAAGHCSSVGFDSSGYAAINALDTTPSGTTAFAGTFHGHLDEFELASGTGAALFLGSAVL